MGRNIPCDLYNEHVVKLIKSAISNMGANLTEKSFAESSKISEHITFCVQAI